MTINRKSNVTYDRWPEFRTAVKEMIAKGTYERLARIHAAQKIEPDGLVRSQHRMHGAMFGPTGYRRFLPWHRAYLIAFERELRAIDSSLSLPYWDWDNDQGRMLGVENFFALSPARNPGLAPGVDAQSTEDRAWFSSEAQTQFYENYTGDYYPFTRSLEGRPHGGGHNWVGGDMSNPRISPNDIIFWMHHAAVDRIWAKWQTNNPGERAFLSGNDARLDPWGSEFTIDNIDDISNLGDDSYSYEDPVRPAPPIG